MEFTNTFSLPVGIDDAFATLTDLEKVAPCMPGAKLETVDGDVYTGRVKVKVGPMSLTYKGKAELVEKDDDAHTARIEARGSEARGGGTANADVTAALTEVEDGTEVVVTTAIDITGKPAQFGRGVMGDVGKKIIDRFADCLARKFDGSDASPMASQDRSRGGSPRSAGRSSPRESTSPATRDIEPRPERDDLRVRAFGTAEPQPDRADLERLTHEVVRITDENTRLTLENARLMEQHTKLIRENSDLRTLLTDRLIDLLQESRQD